MNLLPLLATTATTGSATGSVVVLIGYIAFFAIIIYFMIIRPQKKQQKAQNAMLATLEAGDSILTTSGFYGVVIDVMEDVLIVEFGNNKNCRIPMKKSAVVEVEKPSAE